MGPHAETIGRSPSLPAAIEGALTGDAFLDFLWNVTAAAYEDGDPKLDAPIYWKIIILGYCEQLGSDAAIVARVTDSESARRLLRQRNGESALLSESLLASARTAIGRPAHHAILAWLNYVSGESPTGHSGLFPIPHLEFDRFMDAIDGDRSDRDLQSLSSTSHDGLWDDIRAHVFKHVDNLVNCTLIVAAGVWLRKNSSVSALALPASIGLIVIGYLLLLLAANETIAKLRYLHARPIVKILILVFFVTLYAALTIAFTSYQNK